MILRTFTLTLAALACVACGDPSTTSKPDTGRMGEALGLLAADLPGEGWERTPDTLDRESLGAQLPPTLDEGIRTRLLDGFEAALQLKAHRAGEAGYGAIVIRFRDADFARLYLAQARKLLAGETAAMNGMSFALIRAEEGMGPNRALPGWRVEVQAEGGGRTLVSAVCALHAGRHVALVTVTPRALVVDAGVEQRLARVHAMLDGD